MFTSIKLSTNELTINKLLNSPANYRASYDEHGRFVLLVASDHFP
jgi:hypothetical protein